MKHARWRHSSCVAGDRIYTFGGRCGKDYLASMESVNARKLVAGSSRAIWRTVDIDLVSAGGLLARSHPIMSPIGGEEDTILIAGGFDSNGNKLSDWQLVDLIEETVTSIDINIVHARNHHRSQKGFHFASINN